MGRDLPQSGRPCHYVCVISLSLVCRLSLNFQIITITQLLVEPDFGYESLILWRIIASDSFVQWKKYLTTMQIVQFVIDIAVVYFGSKRSRWIISVATDGIGHCSIWTLRGCVRSTPASHLELCWVGNGCLVWLRPSYLLPFPLHQLLFPNLQEARHNREEQRFYKQPHKREYLSEWNWILVRKFTSSLISLANLRDCIVTKQSRHGYYPFNITLIMSYMGIYTSENIKPNTNIKSCGGSVWQVLLIWLVKNSRTCYSVCKCK